LTENSHRTFTYAEQKFFGMWWDRQNEAIRNTVRKLVSSKQLTFVNGGWCMHDEAATHYMGMIDQTFLGHSFLKREFNVTPKVGWQLDPFGHSATQASLMSYKMGFDALYFGRIDYQDLSKRHADRECEGLWNASSSWKDSTVFWGLTGSYQGNYGAPNGFCFDIHCGEEYHPIVQLEHKALIRAVEDFLLQVRQQSDRTKGNHIMLTMGSDFQYQRAAVNFANTDLLLSTIQHLQEWNRTDEIDFSAIFGPQYDNVNIFYSSPDYYTQCKYKEMEQARKRRADSDEGAGASSTIRALSQSTDKPSGRSRDGADSVTWTVKQDDFFPYSDCPNCFWTGYFTSRPALKRLERVSSSFLMAARQIEGLKDSTTDSVDDMQYESQLHYLEDASGVLQHHDGVSGTSKQHVANDYTKRVQAGIDAVVPCSIRKLKRVLLGAKANDYLTDMAFCQLLNETKCDVSTTATATPGKDVYVIVYNSLAQARDMVVRLPVSTSNCYDVQFFDQRKSKRLKTETICALPSVAGDSSRSSNILPITVESIPPLGAKVARLRESSHTAVDDISNNSFVSNPEENILNVSNGHFSVSIDTKTGNIRRIGSQVVQNLTTWGYYTSFDWKYDRIIDNDHQNSGAYIFRPSTPDQRLHAINAVQAQVRSTSIGVEVHTTYEEPWIKTVTRILKGVPYVEIEYEVGPIPTDDMRGREVVTRYNTMVRNDATFYTDSNG
ncbi:MAG: hypothetical protein SGILL_008086, partial [Bacillariaceae sp.]